jgi:predicted nucleic acid-binding protein
VACTYFDTSVFLAIFNKEESGPQIKSLLRELKRDKIRIYTSVISVQEVSVLSFRKGKVADDNYLKLGKLARIETITREIALTAAKIEAQLLDSVPKDQEENRRRKWDCFHIATAMHLGCATLYAEDPKLLKRRQQLSIANIEFSLPRPRNPVLFPDVSG